MQFNCEFQLAETRADVFMVRPKPRFSSGPSFKSAFWNPTQAVSDPSHMEQARYLGQLILLHRETWSSCEETEVVWNKSQWEHVAVKCEQQKQ